MPLKAVLQNLDDLDEAHKEFYEENEDGTFSLMIEGVQEHPQTRALKNALDRVRAEKKTAADELKAAKDKLKSIPEDFDPNEISELRALKDNQSDDPEDKKKKNDDVQRVREQLEAKHAQQVEEINKELEKERGINRKLIVDDGLTSALVEAGVAREFVNAAKALLKDTVKVVDEDDKRMAIVETDLGPTPLPKFIRDWASTDEGRPFVAKAAGGGAGGGKPKENADNNPWTKDHWNVTEQGRIFRADRAKATKLMRASGMSEDDIKRRTGA